MITTNGVTCRGSYALGTACGHCKRCAGDPLNPANGQLNRRTPTDAERDSMPHKIRKHLGTMLFDALDDGHIDFAFRASRERREIFGKMQDVIRFYVHPANASGDTQDYYIALSENAGMVFVDTLDQAWPDDVAITVNGHPLKVPAAALSYGDLARLAGYDDASDILYPIAVHYPRTSTQRDRVIGRGESVIPEDGAHFDVVRTGRA